MSNSDDVYVALTDPIYDGVREPVDPQLPARSFGGPRRADLGMCTNPIDRFSDRVEEFGAETSTLSLVSPDRVGQFGVSPISNTETGD